MEITPTQVWLDIHKGALLANQTPCSICRNNKSSDPRMHFHGSDWGRCSRRVQNHMMYGDKPLESGQVAMFLADGHRHEESIVTALRAAGYIVTHREGDTDSEIIVKDVVTLPAAIARLAGSNTLEVKTVAHTDGVINGEILLECKSVKEWAYKNKFMKGIVPEDYYGQCQAYLHAHNLDRALLIVKHRETSAICHPFEIKRNDEFIEKRLIELAGILIAIRTSLHSKRKYAKKNYDECKFCAFADKCWSK